MTGFSPILQALNIALARGGGAGGVASITAPRYARDAVGRVVVEDGLVRMQPQGSGLRTDGLKSATIALANARGGGAGKGGGAFSSIVLVHSSRTVGDVALLKDLAAALAPILKSTRYIIICTEPTYTICIDLYYLY